jgi:hypothetical protein
LYMLAPLITPSKGVWNRVRGSGSALIPEGVTR